jgi:hypothetical protein
MKRIIVSEKQLHEFLKKKKAEKTFYEIVENLHKNVKLLNENMSKTNANQSVIDHYKSKNLITPMVEELLIQNKIINNDGEII